MVDVMVVAYICGLNDEKRGAVCDFLGLIDKFNHPNNGQPSLDARVERDPYNTFREMAKARDKWAGDKGFLEENITQKEAVLLLRLCLDDAEFFNHILKILPDTSWGRPVREWGQELGGGWLLVGDLIGKAIGQGEARADT